MLIFGGLTYRNITMPGESEPLFNICEEKKREWEARLKAGEVDSPLSQDYTHCGE